MTYETFIKNWYERILSLMLYKFDREKDKKLFDILDSVKQNKFNKTYENNMKTHWPILREFLDNFEFIEMQAEIMLILYDFCYASLFDLVHSENMKECKRLFEAQGLKEPRELILPSLFIEKGLVVAFSEKEEIDQEYYNLLKKDVILCLNKLQEQKFIQYECTQMNNEPAFLITDIKDPTYYYTRNERYLNTKQCPERDKPISISIGQNTIRDLLYINNIPFSQEYNVTINDTKHRFDFAIYGPNGLRYLIEYDGEQHFKPVTNWGGEAGLEERKKQDKIKNDWAKEHKIPLIRIPYTNKNIRLAHLIPDYSPYLI